MDDNNLNLGLGFDSQSVTESTRELKKQVKTLGSMFQAFKKLKGETEAQAEAEAQVEEQMRKIGVTTGKVIDSVGRKIRKMLSFIIPGAGFFAKIIHGIQVTLGTIVGIGLAAVILPFKWIIKNGLKVINWAFDFKARINEIKEAAVALEHRFVRLSNMLGSTKFANNINNWQHEMLQTLPILRDDLNDFTVAMREMGIDPRSANLRGVVGAALGPGHSYSGVMQAVQSFATGQGDVQGLMDALGRTIDPKEIYKAVEGATSQQDRMLKLMNLLDTKYGENVERSSRLISTNVKFIDAFWSQFKESLVGTPQEGNLMWYIQQVFVDINGWIRKNKKVLLSFADSISRVLGGVGKMIYNMFRGMSGFASKSIGGIQSAAEKFKEWSMRARIQLEDWALRISNVFKEAGESGQGFWETMKKLWDEVFGMGKRENVLATFWEKFKEYGKSAIDWLGEQIASVFGRQFRAGVVNSVKKEDGTFGALVPDFIKRWDKQIEADKKMEQIAGMNMTPDQMRNQIGGLRMANKQYQEDADRHGKKAFIYSAISLNSPEYIYNKAQQKILEKKIKENEEWLLAFDTSMKRASSNPVSSNLSSYPITPMSVGGLPQPKDIIAKPVMYTGTPSNGASTTGSTPVNLSVGGFSHPKDAPGVVRNEFGGEAASLFQSLVKSKGIDNVQINSTTGGKHKTQNHAKGLATDFQATKELMDLFNIAKENRKFGAKKEQVLFDEGGMRIIYEPPKDKDKPWQKGHFHVDGGVSGSLDKRIAEKELGQKYGDIVVNNHIYGKVDDKAIADITASTEKGIRKGASGNNSRISANH